MSYAEIARACEDAIKGKIIAHKESVTDRGIEQMLDERKKYHSRINASNHNRDK